MALGMNIAFSAAAWNLGTRKWLMLGVAADGVTYILRLEARSQSYHDRSNVIRPFICFLPMPIYTQIPEPKIRLGELKDVMPATLLRNCREKAEPRYYLFPPWFRKVF